jgi:hypothetical protein
MTPLDTCCVEVIELAGQVLLDKEDREVELLTLAPER